ncbi:MAG: pyridoxamine 5'-phosphate oxidase family protein, partial [Solirubrobacteraceae bacterium]|nr:pyridoxamine 5'-phosphate oxidase family protein [Solirubrobacteraceae bacterium]
LMPLWYVLRPSGPDGATELWAWTFAKSQKVRNLERDPRATLQIEEGEEYQELRGVMLETEVVLHRDTDDVLGVGLDVFGKYTPGLDGDLADEVVAMVRAQAEKRVALQFTERRRTSWDHRKLGGTY